MNKHACFDCGESFNSSRAFEAHSCVKALAGKSLDELMSLYRGQLEAKAVARDAIEKARKS